ncbi:SusC/RagA family TonB-linked outer membrane protein [Pseudoflavitalea sp. X16]|uniref:SusC/RagA family TonB-linked outer membrane protein n=1 Tax=Paraflavitalea devenefica TaxID=2716334 RepID=UPI001423E6F5|nr:SusC/RagA family TonB-linked outer membrane protein [Paraflavitalea devenefica]NII24228.1 SusC/RagA family TonB-linked outer membrane protein [Paraflavitalea devenefica]
MTSKRLFTAAVLLLLALSISLASLAQDKIITGKVTDSKDGAPVIGASVVPKGSTQGTSTGTDGSFRINVSEGVTTLVVSSVGYTTLEVDITGKTVANVALEASNLNLNEVVVVGYGTARRKDLTGAVASIKSKDFNQGILTSPDQLIQGKVAGVQMINNSGAPGGAATIRIRGNASVRSGNQPLFVVDGFPLDGRTARPGVNIGGVGQTPDANPLNFINPNDIASIDILKDASATAIYGSRGANGVVIITTKRGQTGQPRIDVSANAGISRILKRFDVLDGNAYRAAQTEYGLTGNDKGGNVDALDEITRTAVTQNYYVSIGGGNENGRYRISLGVLDQDGIVRKTSFKKYTANINGAYKFLESKKLGIDFNLLASHNTEHIAPISNDAGFTGSLINQALQWNPTRPLRKASDSLDIEYGSTTVNPLAMSEAYDDVSNITSVLASISPSYKFTDWLEYKILFSINRSVGTRKAQIASFINLEQVVNRGIAFSGTNELTTQQLTHTLSFNKAIAAKLNLNAVAGYEYQKFDNKGSWMVGRDFLSSFINYTNYFQNTSQSTRDIGSFADPISELQSFFGRAAFNYDDRFRLMATFRADGSSKFGKNNRYGYFPSIGASWTITNEEFMSNSNIFNNLNFRVSWGKTGNQEFPAGSAQERFGFSQGAFQQVNVANPDLKWETSTAVNVGLDFSILGDRLFGSLDYFNKKTTDLLFNFDAIQPAPATKYWINLDGEVVNKGFEAGITGVLIQKRDLRWNLGFNATFLKNELNGYNGPAVLTGAIHGQGVSGATVQRLANGRPLNSFFVREFLGIDKATGFSTYTDDGNTFFYIGDPNPTSILGISTDLTWKNWLLIVNMNGSFGHEIYNNTLNSVLPIGNLIGGRNIASSLVAGDVQENLSNALTTSSRYLEKGDYMKLTNATISYRIGNLGKVIRDANVFVTGQNLFIITDFSGFDPEVNTDKQVNGVPSFGIEYSPYPTPRSFILGVRFTL